MTTILQLNGSARTDGSVTRDLTNELVQRLVQENPGADVVTRDLRNVPILDELTVGAIGTDPTDRSEAQNDSLSLSDDIVSEFKAADIIVLAAPMYNFTVPGAVKAYIDLLARAGHTFHYTDQGPAGLVTDRPVYVVLSSGGVPIGSEADFATPYLRHFFSFIGITDVRIVAADMLMFDNEAAYARARTQIDAAVTTQSTSPQPVAS